MITVSIIVPIYNSEKYIKKCIESILSQTFSDIELILIDDGSPDGSGKICDEYKVLDNRVVVLHKQNKGVSSARNAGMEIARGEYITFIDSDDWIKKDFLKEAIREIKEKNLDLYISGFIITDITERKVQNSSIEEEILVENGNISPEIKMKFLQKNYIANSFAKLYRRSAIGTIRFDERLCYGEDLKFVYSVLQRCKRIYAVPQSWYFYCINQGSLTHSITREKCESVRETARFLFDDYYKNYGKLETNYLQNLRERAIYDFQVQRGYIQNSNMQYYEKYGFLHCLMNDEIVRAELKKYFKPTGKTIRSYLRPLRYVVLLPLPQIMRMVFKDFVARRKNES